jgi:hypothetical protein
VLVIRLFDRLRAHHERCVKVDGSRSAWERKIRGSMPTSPEPVISRSRF